MTNVSFKRPLQTVTNEETVKVTTGLVVENAGKIYIPFVFDELEAVTLTASEVDSTVGQTKLRGIAGSFDEIRVGDVVDTLSSGTLTAKSNVTLDDCFTVNGLKIVVYPNTYNSGNLGVHAGDAITGTGIPSDTLVDRIDYASRMIYLDKACTADGVVSLTVAPKIRVTAVRPSTASANANEVDINTTVATASTDATVTFKTATREATPAILRVEPISNTTGARLAFGVSVAYPKGSEVKGTVSGFVNATDSSLNYVSLGTVGFDADLFLLNARFPRSEPEAPTTPD